MKRSELLKQNLTKDQDTELTIKKTLRDDERILKREQRAIEDSIEDLEIGLRDRLSAEAPLDKATVEVTFRNIQQKKELLSLYKQFREEYL